MSVNLHRVFLLIAFAALLVAIGSLVRADDGSVTKKSAQDLQLAYQKDRADAEKAGSKRRFSPELFKLGDNLAAEGTARLEAGKFAEAAQAFREARWDSP